MKLFRDLRKRRQSPNICMKGGIYINDQQRLFCREYLSDFNAARAAAAAGYSNGAASASRLLSREDVREELRSMRSKGDIAEHTEVLEFLTSVMRRTAKEDVFIQNKHKVSWTDDEGNKINDEETVIQTYTMRPKLSDAMSAADKLHKYYCQQDTDETDAGYGIVILPEVNKPEMDERRDET